MSKKTSSNIINYDDNELDSLIAEAIEQFALSNIRFRSPNRNNGSIQQMRPQKLEREIF